MSEVSARGRERRDSVALAAEGNPMDPILRSRDDCLGKGLLLTITTFGEVPCWLAVGLVALKS